MQDRIFKLKDAEAKIERERVAKELAEADVRIAEAQRGAAEANARATKAQESLALAEQHSVEANAKAEGFRLDIAKANERAASATETAERERLERLRLETRLAPRSLSQFQQNDIRTRLAAHGPRGVDVLLFGNTSEIVSITQQVLAAFPTGWNIKLWSTLPGGMAVSGFVVVTRSGSDQAIETAADVIVSSLRANGIASVRGEQFTSGELPAALTGPPWDAANVAPIRILVGGKP